MKKFLKISALVLVILFAVLLSLPFLYKGKIIQTIKDEANKSLNARLNFSDDISIGLIRSFPQLSLQMKQLSISGVDTFQNDTLVYLPVLDVRMNLMSVIRGEKIEISSIALEQPAIKLLVLENGKANWDITKPDSAAADTSPSAFKMALEELNISKGHLVYDDRSLGFYTALEQFDHKLKGDFTLDKFLMETVTKAEALTLAYGGVNYIHKASADLKVNLDMDMKEMKFTFSDNDILLNQLHLGGEGFVDMNDEDMDFDLAFRSKQTDFKTIMSMIPAVYSKDFGAAKASGKLAFSGYMKGRMTDDKMPGFGLKLDIDKGYFQYPSLPKSLSNIFINLSVDNATGFPDNTVIDLKRFDADIAGEHLFAKLFVKHPVSDPFVDGALKGNVNLSEFRSFIPLEKSTELSGLIRSDVHFSGLVSALQNKAVEKFNAVGSIAADNFRFKDQEMLPQGTAFNALLNFSPATLDLAGLKGTVGMSDFDVKGRVDNLFGYLLRDELLKGNFTLNSDYMNANEFLTDEEVKKEPTASDSLPLQAFEVPGNIDFVFSSGINTLIYDNLKLTDLAGNIILRDREMLFEKLGVNLLQGSMSLTGVYDSRNPKFPFSNMDFSLKSIDILESFKTFDLVKKLMPLAEYTHGHFNAGIKMSNNFKQDFSVDYPSVSAVINLGLTEAFIKDFPVLNLLAEKLKIEKLKNLNLKNQKLRLVVQDGKVALDSMIMPLWTGAKAKISGYTALDQSIKYVAKLSIPRKDFGEANTALNALSSQAEQKGIKLKLSDMVDVDVLIGGFLKKPDIKLSLHDAKNSLVDNVKDQLKDQLEQQKQAAMDEARRRADAARKKTMDSLNRVKQMATDKLAAERKALEDKAAEEKRIAEEKAKAEADRIKQEADKKIQEEKKKALDKLKGGILK